MIVGEILVTIPENVLNLLKDPQAVKLLSTVCPGNKPHSIVAGTIAPLGDSQMMIGEVLMKKSAANLAKNPNAAFNVVKGMESYEIHCTFKEQVKSGPVYDEVKAMCEKIHLPLSSLYVFDVDSVYNESANHENGKKLA